MNARDIRKLYYDLPKIIPSHSSYRELTLYPEHAAISYNWIDDVIYIAGGGDPDTQLHIAENEVESTITDRRTMFKNLGEWILSREEVRDLLVYENWERHKIMDTAKQMADTEQDKLVDIILNKKNMFKTVSTIPKKQGNPQHFMQQM